MRGKTPIGVHLFAVGVTGIAWFIPKALHVKPVNAEGVRFAIVGSALASVYAFAFVHSRVQDWLRSRVRCEGCGCTVPAEAIRCSACGATCNRRSNPN